MVTYMYAPLLPKGLGVNPGMYVHYVGSIYKREGGGEGGRREGGMGGGGRRGRRDGWGEGGGEGGMGGGRGKEEGWSGEGGGERRRRDGRDRHENGVVI